MNKYLRSNNYESMGRYVMEEVGVEVVIEVEAMEE